MKLRELLESMFLAEDKISYLANQQNDKLLSAAKADDQDFKTSEEIVKALTKADPTQKLDYLMFIIKMYVAKQFKMEDLSRIKTDLELFHKVRPKLPVEKRDLNKSKSLNDLLDLIQPFENANPDELLSGGELAKKTKEGAKTVISTPHFKVIAPTTEEAACLYGANTKWCTASKTNNMFHRFLIRKWTLSIKSQILFQIVKQKCFLEPGLINRICN